MINKHASSKNSMPQMALFGSGTKAVYEHHYFFALCPDEQVREQLCQAADDLRKNHGIDGSWIGGDRYYLSLHHLGQFPDARSDLVSRAMTAASKIQARSFTIKLDQFMSLDSKTGKFPCVLNSADESPELKHFWQLLKNNLLAVRLGEYLNDNFKASAALLYTRQPVAEFLLPKPIQWPVRDFVLIESLVGKSEHIELGRWPLADITK